MIKWVKDIEIECDTYIALKAPGHKPGQWWRATLHESGGGFLEAPEVQMDIFDSTDSGSQMVLQIESIDDLIARLQTLRDTAKDHFGPSWNKK